MKNKVFLGGTVNGSQWRKKLIPKLSIDYFDPVVQDWNEKAYLRELKEREQCEFRLYVLTPKMKGVYSIAEVIDDSNKRPNGTLLCIINKDGSEQFSEFQKKSLSRVARMVKKNGAKVLSNLDETANYLNKNKKAFFQNGFISYFGAKY